VTRPDPRADNKARARLIWAELFNARDLRLAPALFAPEFVNHNARPGTPKGPDGVAEVFIRPATHRPFAARQMHALTFNADGLVTEHLAVRDDLTMLRQLGVDGV
jgi:predicted SnoaL-like aldol condensation-catalyzing enzyme